MFTGIFLNFKPTKGLVTALLVVEVGIIFDFFILSLR